MIIDRISQDIPFYRAYLKNAALHGTIVINNPFWWTADDKFFNYALAQQDGRGDSADGAFCRTTSIRAGTTDQSMRNLMFPLNWEESFDYVGFPAFLKPYRRRRMEECLQGAFAGGVLSRPTTRRATCA